MAASRSLDTSIGPAAEQPARRGTPRTPHAAARSRTSPLREARDICTASRRTKTRSIFTDVTSGVGRSGVDQQRAALGLPATQDFHTIRLGAPRAANTLQFCNRTERVRR